MGCGLQQLEKCVGAYGVISVGVISLTARRRRQRNTANMD